jgi:transposase
VKKIPKQEYTAEFKEQAVKHAQEVGIVVAARELGLIEQTLRNWVKASATGKLTAPGAEPVTPEQMELSRLRAESALLKMHFEILQNFPRGVAPSRWREAPGCLALESAGYR